MYVTYTINVLEFLVRLQMSTLKQLSIAVIIPCSYRPSRDPYMAFNLREG